jgi:GH18 family chitinase
MRLPAICANTRAPEQGFRVVISKSEASVTRGYNIADLQKNGVADELTHLFYAFGDVTAAGTPVCAVADPVAAYQNSTLPGLSGKACTAPFYGNFAAIQQLKELHLNSGQCPNPNKTAPSPVCDILLTAGFLSYATIENLTNKNGYTAWYDAARVGATLYNLASGTFYSYDDVASIATKTDYIKKNQLGGAYVWALNDEDAAGSLTKAIAGGLK